MKKPTKKEKERFKDHFFELICRIYNDSYEILKMFEKEEDIWDDLNL